MAGARYAIGEVAKLTKVPVKTIRYYADIGLLPPAEVAESGYRRYTATEIWQLELIRTLRATGFSIEDIRGVLRGDVPVATAIDWQLDALGVQIRQLTRMREILQQARASADPDEALCYLHRLGAAQRLDVEERRRFLERLVGTAVLGPDAPPAWRDQLVGSLTAQLPEELSVEQAAAWAELHELLEDPAFTATMQERVAPFWEFVRTQEVDADRWHERMLDIGRRALAALDGGATPESPETQVIVADYAALFAGALGQPCTPEFVRGFAATMSRSIDGRSRRLEELVAILRSDGPARCQARANQLILAGLQWRAGQLERDAGGVAGVSRAIPASGEG